MKTEDKNQEEETHSKFITRQMKIEEERKAKARMRTIEQQMKDSLKFAEENGGA